MSKVAWTNKWKIVLSMAISYNSVARVGECCPSQKISSVDETEARLGRSLPRNLILQPEVIYFCKQHRTINSIMACLPILSLALNQQSSQCI